MLKAEIQPPEGFDVSLEKGKLRVKGSNGEVIKEFRHPMVSLSLADGKITISAESGRRKVRAIAGTWEVLIKNMFSGASKGWRAELKLVYSHFPVKLKADGGSLVIDNFLGEKSPRRVPIPSGLKVEIDQGTVTVSGPDKEMVGRMAGRIEQATRVRGYDKRVFQDGIYITRKPFQEGEE